MGVKGKPLLNSRQAIILNKLIAMQIHGDHHWREQLQITSMLQLSQCGKIRTSIGDTVINF